MRVMQSVLEIVSALAVFQSTTVAVLGLVSLLFLYRRLVGSGYRVQKGEVRRVSEFVIGIKDTCLLSATQRLPPHVPSPVPYLGHAVEFGRNPIKFLLDARKKVGNSPILQVTCISQGNTYHFLLVGNSLLCY